MACFSAKRMIDWWLFHVDTVDRSDTLSCYCEKKSRDFYSVKNHPLCGALTTNRGHCYLLNRRCTLRSVQRIIRFLIKDFSNILPHIPIHTSTRHSGNCVCPLMFPGYRWLVWMSTVYCIVQKRNTLMHESQYIMSIEILGTKKSLPHSA